MEHSNRTLLYNGYEKSAGKNGKEVKLKPRRGEINGGLRPAGVSWRGLLPSRRALPCGQEMPAKRKP